MPDITKLQENLGRRRYDVHYFDTSAQANEYLVGELAGKTVGRGGAMTVVEMGLDKALEQTGIRMLTNDDSREDVAKVQAYITSMNGVAETGELVNIDGVGNRVAATAFGHEELYIIFGVNKIEPDLDRAIWRARNVAAPKNARRLEKNTPCAVKGDKCYDCNSPDRICRVMSVHWSPPRGFQRVVIVIVGESLGL